MAVHAIVQAAQHPQSTSAQEQTGGTSDATAGGEFADLLKNLFGTGVSGSALLNSQAMIDMASTAPAYTPPAPPQPPVQQASTTTGNQSSSQTNTGSSGAAGTAATPSTVSATDPNGGNNGGSGGHQQDASQQNQQQAAPQSNGGGTAAPTQASQAAAPAKPANANGDDATTEAAAAAMAAVYAAQPPQAPAPVVEAVSRTAGAGTAAAGQASGPNQADAAQPAQQAQAADDEGSSDETPIWSANFLASAAATTPQMAQQAAGLSQIAGTSGGTVSTQSATGSGASVAAPSAGALVPDAVLAVPGFFANGQGGGSTGGDGAGQDAAQQQAAGTDPTDPTADADALGLAEGAQALFALASLTQTAAQGVIAGQTQGALAGVTAAAAAAPASGAAAEAALPQSPTQAPTANANTSNFAAQVQNAEEGEAPQQARQVTLPSAVDQLKMQIEKGIQAGSTTIKVQLTPDSLGRVDVKLDIQNGAVKATITADRPETVALLKSDQAGMVQALQDAGLNADSSSLSFYLRGDQQRQFAQNQGQTGRQGRNQSGDAGAGDDPLAGVTATSAASSASGASGLDISV